MKITGKSIAFIVLCLAAALGGLLWAADLSGLISIKDATANLSYKAVFMKQPPGNTDSIPTESPIEKENLELRAALRNLEERLAALEGEKTSLLKQLEETQQELTVLRVYQREKESLIVNTGQMASYYAEMKPEAVVEVMNNLDDNTVMSILPLLEKDQVAKILALMEPQRAALLTQLMLGGNSPDL